MTAEELAELTNELVQFLPPEAIQVLASVSGDSTGVSPAQLIRSFRERRDKRARELLATRPHLVVRCRGLISGQRCSSWFVSSPNHPVVCPNCGHDHQGEFQ